jgi:sugar phosphate isomerase/epimerase
MRTLSRREFALAAAAPFMATRLAANPLGLPIGCQTYPVRDQIDNDFHSTLRQLAAIGYQNIEMCSPPGYAKAGYGKLATVKASDLKSAIHAAGLNCDSSHFQFRELKENLDERIAWAKELGLSQMVCSTFSVPRTATMADWMKAADDLNKAAEKIAQAGMRTGFHNHAFEFSQIDGVLIYDKLMSELDPKLVGMQFQTGVMSLGFEAATFFEKYPGRFVSMHLQDISAPDKKTVAIGQGMIDWKKTFAAAKKAGVRNYFVEMNLDLLKSSYPYLRGLSV